MASLQLTNASDACLLAGGPVVVGRWSTTGLAANVLQEVDSYSEATIGAIGPRAVYQLSDVTTAAITQPTGTVRGILSLHPSGYALVQVGERTLALWQRTAPGVWTEVAWGEAEAAGSAGYIPSDEVTWAGTGVSALCPGSYRLETFGGDLWALTFGSGRAALVLRGSALVPIVATDIIPAAVTQSFALGSNVQVGGQTTSYESKARWREAWWYRGAHDVALYGAEVPWFNLRHNFFPQSILADGAAVYGAGLNALAFAGFAYGEWPATCPAGALAGEWARWDGLRLLRADVDCLPLSGRQTAGALWLLGTDAAGMFPLSQWAQTYFDETGTWGDGYATRTDLLVPTALYRLGALQASVAFVQVEAAAHPNVGLAFVQVEAGGATPGADSPTLAEVEVSATDSTLAGESPIIAQVQAEAAFRDAVLVSFVQVEAGAADSTAEVTVGSVQVEAAYTPTGPDGSEDILTFLVTAATGVYRAFRAVYRLALEDWATPRLMYRADAEGLPIDLWASYTHCLPGPNVYLPEVATTLRFVVVKPIATAKVSLDVMLCREEES